MATPVTAADLCAVVGSIDPDAYAAAAYTSTYADAADFHTLMAVIQVGTLGASATVDAKLVQATDSSGTGVKDITGAAITQLTQAGSDSDKQAIISIQNSALDVANDFRYVAVVLTVATATSDASAVILGLTPRVGPASDNDATTVDEVVRA